MKRQSIFQEPVVEVIKKRRSVRSYEKTPIPREIREKIQSFISQNQQGPLGKSVRLSWADDRELVDKSDGKIGTYGVIKGASTYIGAVVEKDPRQLIDLGYVFEKVILYCTSLGLGTCWLGGTFKRSGFIKAMDLKEDEILPAVTPLGFPEERKRLVDTIIRTAAGSNQRKSWEKLFFYESFQRPLDKKIAGRYGEALEMVRLGPSASNKQPWRILMEEGKLHFYLQAARAYEKGLGFSIQKIDMGIAMCHLEMVLQEAEIEGSWEIITSREWVNSDGLSYIASWIETTKK